MRGSEQDHASDPLAADPLGDTNAVPAIGPE